MNEEFSSWIEKIINQRYRIKRTLANGGMGMVLLAFDQHLNKDVVIKVPVFKFSEQKHETLYRFNREVLAHSTLEHPNIVPIIDSGFYEDHPFLVLQYIKNGTLRTVMDFAKLSNEVCFPNNLKLWLPQISSALDFIHSNNWVHRDVKPENILFDSNYNPYLTDFGILKNFTLINEEAVTTSRGSFIGSPQYMAPEQHLGKKITAKTDQFALAVIIYECLSGKLPFNGNNHVGILLEIVNQKAPPLKDRVANLPVPISDAVMKALSEDPDDRFENCNQLCNIIMNELPSNTPNNKENHTNHFQSSNTININEILNAKLLWQVNLFCSQLMEQKTLNNTLYTSMKKNLSEHLKAEIPLASMLNNLLDFFTMSGTIEATNYEDITQALKRLIPELNTNTN
jgi:serine/threonine-protein kinase